MKKYRVTWITKQNRREEEHERIIEAENAKAAREAFDAWQFDKEASSIMGRHWPHAFRIQVKLLK